MTGIFQLSIWHLTAKYSLCRGILLCEHSFVKFKLNPNKKISVNITGRHCTKKQRKAINIGIKIGVIGPVERGDYITYIKLKLYRN